MAYTARESKRAAYIAALKSDLKNLVVAEEMYFADNLTYIADLNKLRFKTSPGVTITFYQVARNHWIATAAHESMPGVKCMTSVGSESPLGSQGEPVCAR